MNIEITFEFFILLFFIVVVFLANTRAMSHATLIKKMGVAGIMLHIYLVCEMIAFYVLLSFLVKDLHERREKGGGSGE